MLKEEYSEISLLLNLILTRWSTWLEADEYYADHIDAINSVLYALDFEGAEKIDTTKAVVCDTSVKNDNLHSAYISMYHNAQIRHLSLSENFEIMESTVEQLIGGCRCSQR